MLVLGDTNSCIAAVMAKRMRIPVYHMEAGNRCFDENVPEETNRRLVDHVADFNLVYTEHARRNLLAEGLQPRRILLTGSPMREVLEPLSGADRVLDRPRHARSSPSTTTSWSARIGRRMSTISTTGNISVSASSGFGQWSIPVLVSTHPRTRKRIEGLEAIAPRGYSLPRTLRLPRLQRLQLRKVRAVRFGTVAEESVNTWFPAITLRESIERPEALDSGAIVMTGLNVEDILEPSSSKLNETRRSVSCLLATKSKTPRRESRDSSCPRHGGTRPGLA